MSRWPDMVTWARRAGCLPLSANTFSNTWSSLATSDPSVTEKASLSNWRTVNYATAWPLAWTCWEICRCSVVHWSTFRFVSVNYFFNSCCVMPTSFKRLDRRSRCSNGSPQRYSSTSSRPAICSRRIWVWAKGFGCLDGAVVWNWKQRPEERRMQQQVQQCLLYCVPHTIPNYSNWGSIEGFYYRDGASDALQPKLTDSSPPNATATESTLAYRILHGDKRSATLG